MTQWPRSRRPPSKRTPEPTRARRRALRRPATTRRPHPVRVVRGVSRPGRRRLAQDHGPLPDLARHRRAIDGGAACRPRARRAVARRARLVTRCSSPSRRPPRSCLALAPGRPSPDVRAMGSRVFVVTGRSSAPSADVIAALDASGMALLRWPVDGEPTVAVARRPSTPRASIAPTSSSRAEAAARSTSERPLRRCSPIRATRWTTSKSSAAARR